MKIYLNMFSPSMKNEINQSKNVLFYQDINQSISFHFSSSIIFGNDFPKLDCF